MMLVLYNESWYHFPPFSSSPLSLSRFRSSFAISNNNNNVLPTRFKRVEIYVILWRNLTVIMDVREKARKRRVWARMHDSLQHAQHPRSLHTTLGYYPIKWIVISNSTYTLSSAHWRKEKVSFSRSFVVII